MGGSFERNDPTPFFFNNGMAHFLVVSALACPVIVEYSFRAEQTLCAAGRTEPERAQLRALHHYRLWSKYSPANI